MPKTVPQERPRIPRIACKNADTAAAGRCWIAGILAPAATRPTQRTFGGAA
ncbi:hypothetical protein P3T37_001306 [Kitasatospora sp. MAA4]|uniref:hypothetical protein n=1 Tax=Kitasatospora sp. MAA4 TaxID=3035093 RepID=UPI0024772D7E|nr:hypothetical protein [Kitasatospora sp. MAA4]MDH6131932.1 hypothetical protein [Kitasatospora sp. MAA4]